LQAFSLGAQRAEDSCAIKPLAFAMGTEAHGNGFYRDAPRRATSGLLGLWSHELAIGMKVPQLTVGHRRFQGRTQMCCCPKGSHRSSSRGPGLPGHNPWGFCLYLEKPCLAARSPRRLKPY